MQLSQHIESFDIFGHSIALNFDRKGDTHKTVIGGICSSLLVLLLLIYVCLLGRDLFMHHRDDVSLFTNGLDLKNEPAIKFKNTDTFFYFILKK